MIAPVFHFLIIETIVRKLSAVDIADLV